MMSRVYFSSYSTPARRNWRKILLDGKPVGKITHGYDGRDFYHIQMNQPYITQSLFGRFDSMEAAQAAVTEHFFYETE